MKKPGFFAALSVLLCVFLSGCQGYREIDGEYLISAIGFKEEGAKHTVYAEVLEVAADKKDTENKLFFAAGKTPYEAVESIAELLPKKAVFDHCGTAIIENETSKESLEKIIKYLYDTKNLNLGICLYCAADAREILSLKPQTLSIGYDIMAIKNNIEKTSGISFKNKYYEICGLSISKKGFCLPEISVKDESPGISGQTVYADLSPVLRLDKNEMMIFNLLSGGSNGGEISISGQRCRYNKISVYTEETKSGTKVEINCKYRGKKHRATAALKTESEKLLDKICGTPAARLILPRNAATAERPEVVIYDR